MHVCQHCTMYMKPFINRTDMVATCEFCGEVVYKLADSRTENLVALLDKGMTPANALAHVGIKKVIDVVTYMVHLQNMGREDIIKRLLVQKKA